MASSKNKFQVMFQFGAKKANSFEKTIAGIENKIGGLTKTAAGIAAGFVSVSAIKGAVDTFAGFEQAMANVQALSGASGDTFLALKNKALEMGEKTSKTAQEAAEALGYMALAGWDAEKSITSLEPVLRLSEAGQLDLARTSDLVTDSMSALSLQANMLPEYLDKVAQTSRKSNTNIDTMMEAFIQMGETIKDVPLEEASAALGVLANRGLKGAEAGNSINSLLTNFKLKSGQAYEALKQLNVSAYDSKEKFKGIQQTMVELNHATKNLTEKQRDMYFSMIGGKTQIDTLNKLMGGLNTVTESGANEFDYLRGQIQNSNGALSNMADTMNDTVNGSFTRLQSAFDSMKIKAVDTFAPYISTVVDSFASKIPNATNHLVDNLKNGVHWMELIFQKPKSGQDSAQAIQDITAMTGFGSSKAASIFNQFQSGISGKVGGVMELLGFDSGSIQMITDKIDAIVLRFDSLKRGILKVADMAKPAVNWITSSGLPIALRIALEFGDGIISLLADLAHNWDTYGPIIAGIAGGFAAFKVISEVKQKFDALKNTISGIGTAFKAFNLLSNPIAAIAVGIGLVIAAGVLLYQNWDKIKAGAIATWEGIKETFSKVPDFFSGIWDGVCDTFKSFINFFIKGINWIISGINKISITTPDWLPGDLGGKTMGFNIPEVPMLAKGGIATAPTLAMVGEGSEKEAILPLSKLRDLLGEFSGERKETAFDKLLKICRQPTANLTPAAASGPTQYVYSPVYHLHGSAGKAEVMDADAKNQQDFIAKINYDQELHQRTSFKK